MHTFLLCKLSNTDPYGQRSEPSNKFVSPIQVLVCSPLRLDKMSRYQMLEHPSFSIGRLQCRHAMNNFNDDLETKTSQQSFI